MKIRFLPKRSSISVYVLSLISLIFAGWIEFIPSTVSTADADRKMQASQRTYDAFNKIREKILSQNLTIDPQTDSSDTGLIGPDISSVTSSAGKLSSKLASIHPDFAAWFMDQFRQAGLEEGDTVAVGMSGSFPALNIALLIAADKMQLNVISIASVSSSQYGANRPEFLWPDMERYLYLEKIILRKSVYMSIGGVSDAGIGIGKEGKDLILASIRKNGYTFLSADSFEDSLVKRWNVYQEGRVSLYVNIGGGTVSSGTSLGKKKIPKGVVLSGGEFSELPDSILKSFLRTKVPVLHVSGIESISNQFKMRYSPGRIPLPGSSDLIFQKKRNRWLSGCFWILLLVLIWKFSAWITLSDQKDENTISL